MHGPLTALLLVQLLETQLHSTNRQLLSFDYRATKPLFVDRPIQLMGKWETDGKASLLAVDDTGDIAMKATASYEM